MVCRQSVTWSLRNLMSNEVSQPRALLKWSKSNIFWNCILDSKYKVWKFHIMYSDNRQVFQFSLYHNEFCLTTKETVVGQLKISVKRPLRPLLWGHYNRWPQLQLHCIFTFVSIYCTVFEDLYIVLIYTLISKLWLTLALLLARLNFGHFEAKQKT